MSVSASAFNNLFNTKLGSAEQREKLADYGGAFVRDRLREVSYARKVVPTEMYLVRK